MYSNKNTAKYVGQGCFHSQSIYQIPHKSANFSRATTIKIIPMIVLLFITFILIVNNVVV